MLDKSRIGYRFPPYQTTLEKGRLRFFALAIGETSPLYVDEAAAGEAGFPSLPMPPTFAFSLGKEGPDPNDTLALFGLDIANILHGEQSFDYYSIPCAGDVLTVRKEVVDVYERKNGELGFIVLKNHIVDENDEPVCDMTQTIIVKADRTAQP